jgi:hypothetical protein
MVLVKCYYYEQNIMTPLQSLFIIQYISPHQYFQ